VTFSARSGHGLTAGAAQQDIDVMPSKKPKLGRSDRYPSDYGVRDRDERNKKATDKSWSPGDKGQGREGYSKGYGGSGGKGTGASGPQRKKASR
jgi:hypothetical protein